MKFLNYDVINQIKMNLEYYHQFFLQDNYHDRLNDEFGRNYYTNNEIPYLSIDFDTSVEIKKHKKQTDFNNAIAIYKAYGFLSESQASDERFWCGLALELVNMSYLFYRWGETKNTIQYRVTYHTPGKRGMVYHGLARLWWFVHLTRIPGDDPYDLTRFAFEYPHILEKMIYRNFSNSGKIRHAIILAIKEYVDNGGKYSTKKIDELYKYVSIISGNRLLDLIPQEELISELVMFMNKVSTS
jgi:hypothetical protein